MKKLLLSSLAVCGMLFSASAQNFTNGATGYTIDYAGTMGASKASCLDNLNPFGGAGYQFGGGNISGTPSLVKNGSDIYLNIKTGSATIDTAAAPGFFDIYSSQSGSCNSMRGDVVGINMTSNGKVSIYAKSDVNKAGIRIYLGSSTGGFPTNTFGSVTSIIWDLQLTTSYAVYTMDLSGTPWTSYWNSWADKNNVNMIGYTMLTPNANYYIKDIALGTDAPLNITGVDNAVLPSNVTYYPNPSNSNITVSNMDVTSLKLMNLSGSVVRETSNSSVSVEGLNPGMYFLQINGYKPVKVTVE
jgi:hypothetical protein